MSNNITQQQAGDRIGLMSEKLESLGVYVEFSVGNKWCYKYQFPGQAILITTHEEKEKAANNFFIEYLKSLHYSIRSLWESNRLNELNQLIEKMKAFKEPNIDKCIEILERSGVKL